LEVLGGLANDRLITAAVVRRNMDLVRLSQHPMDMGENREDEISPLFQCSPQNTMNMGSILRRNSTRVGVLSNTPQTKGAPMTRSFNTKSNNLKSAALALAVLIAGVAQASAGSGPTMQEKMACHADAATFCSQFVGKAPQMRACLEQNKAKLSAPCRAVVEAHGG